MELNLFFVITLIEVEKIINYFSAIYVCINYGSAFESKKKILSNIILNLRFVLNHMN